MVSLVYVLPHQLKRKLCAWGPRSMPFGSIQPLLHCIRTQYPSMCWLIHHRGHSEFVAIMCGIWVTLQDTEEESSSRSMQKEENVFHNKIYFTKKKIRHLCAFHFNMHPPFGAILCKGCFNAVIKNSLFCIFSPVIWNHPGLLAISWRDHREKKESINSSHL